MARKHPGRPSLGINARTQLVSIKVSQTERVEILRAAKAAGLSLSAWIRMMIGLAIVTMTIGCVSAKTWMPVAATSLAMTATACDWEQTRTTAGTRGYRWEENMLLGPDPGRDAVDGYFAEVGLIEASTGAVLTKMPTKIRYVGIAAMLLVAGYEVELARENVNAGTRRCY